MEWTFSATLLLTEPWALDVDAIADATRSQFPEIGAVDVISDQETPGKHGMVSIDGAIVSFEVADLPFLATELTPALKTLQAWDSEEVVRTHRAQLNVTCSANNIRGLDDAKAYAAACHFVAAAAATIAPASAVFWRTGWVLSEAAAFVDAAKSLVKGRIPIVSWISFATIVPTGAQSDDISGMVTYGLHAFVGRELELAPRHEPPRTAFRILNGALREVLTLGTELTDGGVLKYAMDDLSIVVRLRPQWLRRDVPAIVLVSNDSILDTETLRLVHTT